MRISMSKNWTLAPALQQLREQINAAFPSRDRSSDGSIGDTRHSSRKSDHNPNAAGVVCAIDIDEDLSPSNTVAGIVAQIQMSRDSRVAYLIYEGQTTVKGDITRWKDYHGVNPHKHHAHISVKQDAKLYNDRRPWQIAGAITPDINIGEPAFNADGAFIAIRDLKIGDTGDDVAAVQTALGINADGIFGPNTRRTVISFQSKNGLDADGIVGAATRQKLGI